MTNHDKIQKEFREIYDSFADAIFHFCLVRVSHREQALDLTQETFTRLWQSLLKGNRMINARSFIFTIAHRLIIDWYRKKKPISLESLAGEEDGEPYEPIDESAKMSSEIEAEGRFLIDAIRKLGSSYRQSVYLRYVEGLSPPEIGEIIGISANAVSVRINRGIEELRKLTGYHIEMKDK